MRRQPWMRRFDFDAEAAVSLSWRGVRPDQRARTGALLPPDEGGVSHFNYWRDNALLTWMHLRLFIGFLLRLPLLAARRARRDPRSLERLARAIFGENTEIHVAIDLDEAGLAHGLEDEARSCAQLSIVSQ